MTAILFFSLVSQVTPLYTARASLMLDPRSVQVLTSDNVISDLNLSNPVLDTEAAVLRSNLLLEKVVREIGIENLAPIDPAKQEPSTTERLTGQIRFVLVRLLGIESGASAPALEQEARDIRRLIASLRRSMTVWREGQSYLIAVAIETPDPLLSQKIANTLIEVYIREQIETRNKVIRNATAFLTERIEEMRLNVEASGARIEDFRSKQLAESGASPETVERQVLELSTQLALAQADLAQIEARSERIQDVISTTGIEGAAELLTSPFVLSLRQQISEANRKDAELATRFSEDYPDRLVVRGELARLKEELAAEVRKILANLDNDVAVARARVESVRNSVETMEARAVAISRTNVNLRQLEREAEAVRASYQDMLNRLSETRSTERLQLADARQVERAMVPGAPSSPRTMLFTVFGATIGFAIGLMITFYLTVSKAGFTTAREIEKSLGVPVITSLQQNKLRTRAALIKLLRTSPYNPFVERLRQLRTVLLMQHKPDGEGLCLQLTSSVANESKTSTTVALAYLEARAQRRCIVLDFDLRRSSLSRDFQYSAESDLSDILLRGHPIQNAIYHVEDLGFDLITMRKPVPQMSDYLDPMQVRRLIEQLKANYDLVLIDSAPLLLVADTLRLAPLVDTVLLLVRQKTTRRKAVQQSARKLQEVGAKSLSIAMTFTDPSTEEDTYGAYANYSYVE